MMKFLSGLVLGGLAVASVPYIYKNRNNTEAEEYAKKWAKDAKSDLTSFTHGIDKLMASSRVIAREVPQVKDTISELSQLANDYKQEVTKETEPMQQKVNRIKADIAVINAALKSIKA